MNIPHPKYEVGQTIYIPYRNGNYVRVRSSKITSFESSFTFKVGPNSPDEKYEVFDIEYKIEDYTGTFSESGIFPTFEDAYNSLIKESKGEIKIKSKNL